MRPADFPWALAVLLATAAVARLGTRGGHPIEGCQGLSDMLGTLTALAIGMLVAAAAAGRQRLA